MGVKLATDFWRIWDGLVEYVHIVSIETHNGGYSGHIRQVKKKNEGQRLRRDSTGVIVIRSPHSDGDCNVTTPEKMFAHRGVHGSVVARHTSRAGHDEFTTPQGVYLYLRVEGPLDDGEDAVFPAEVNLSMTMTTTRATTEPSMKGTKQDGTHNRIHSTKYTQTR